MDQMTRKHMLHAIGWANSSTYKRTHVGAVVVKGDRSAGGCNNKIYKGCHIHAEVACLVEAARQGIKTAGCQMYCTWAACPACAAAIVAAGISIVHVLGAAMDQTDPKWQEEVDAGLNILREGDVTLIRHDETMNTVLRMNDAWFTL